ncbi:protein FAM13A-like isoform X2 [Montipora foliosa]|uniref:protein FAM13A-like isoform X2 n=1 Tax=Montipora foliosa TaxID=591990 RepID=UPI0035F209F6
MYSILEISLRQSFQWLSTLIGGIRAQKSETAIQSSDQLPVPQTAESRMAKMKKKISSPLMKRRSLGGGVIVMTNKTFGVSIDELLRKAQECDVPPVVTTIVEYLEKHGLSHEGIFRISGNHKVVESLKASFDRDGEVDLEHVGDVMAVAGLLKLFLRELPEPLVPQNLKADFIQIHKAHQNNGGLLEMKSVLEKMPASSYQLLKYLCRFLVRVSMNEENNKMSCTALAIVFGPNFFRCKDGIEGLHEQGQTNAIVCKFIQEFDTLFEVSPYATTDIFKVQEANQNNSSTIFTRNKYSEKVVNEKQLTSVSQEASLHCTDGKDRTNTHEDDGPTYATVKKPRKSLQPIFAVSSSTEDLDMYVRSVSPSWNSQASDSAQAPEASKTVGGKEIVQKAINDTIKEHLFGPDLTSTDENSPHSPESGDEGPPLPSRNYGEDDIGKLRRRRRRNAKSPKEPSGSSNIAENSEHEKTGVEEFEQEKVKLRQYKKAELARPRPKSEGYQIFEKKGYIVGLDKNSNNVLESTYPLIKSKSSRRQDELSVYDDGLKEKALNTNDDVLSVVKRNSAILSSLTRGRAPPPKNRRRPNLRKLHDSCDAVTEDDSSKHVHHKRLVHPLVDEVKSKDLIRTTPPKSPRSSRSSKIQPSSSALRPEGDVDEVDAAPFRPMRDNLGKHYNKKHHTSPAVPPLELYKLQQDDSIPDIIQLSPRERYDGLNTDEALVSPRTRPLTIDTRTIPYECPPSPPHEQIEHSWFERRMDSSPKGEQTIKQLTKTISQLKKKIRDFEDAFEDEHCRRPLQSEKAPIKKYVAELGRARKQLRELKERAKEEAGRLNETVPPMSISQGMKGSRSEPLLTTTPATIEDSLERLLLRLDEKRGEDGRPEEVELMAREQLQDEKLAVQKALLQHESLFGRPSTKKDKDVMRPLYDRYRTIKRKLAAPASEAAIKLPSGGRPRTSSIDRLMSDLAPIHEDAPLHSPSGGSPARLTQSLPVTSGRGSSRSRLPGKSLDAALADTQDSDNEGLSDTIQDTLSISTTVAQLREDDKFHTMTRQELNEQLELKRKEKKKMRKKLKTFEDDFFEKTGRRVQREDRGDMEPEYQEYKHIKHQLKLIEALLAKRKASNTL